MAVIIQIRRDVAANWIAENPVLASGEMGIELDTVPPRIKVGNGLDTWTALEYLGGTGGGLAYQGTWDASTNTPTIVSAVGSNGAYYVVSVAGTTDIDGITDWQVGDWIIFNGNNWQKIDNSDQVSSVFGRQGAVVATAGDYNASQVTVTPVGDVVATDVQAAIEELDTEKEPVFVAGTTTQYLRGDKTFQTVPSADVTVTPVGAITQTNVQDALVGIDTRVTAHQDLFADMLEPSGFDRADPDTLGILEFSPDGITIHRIDQNSNYSVNTSGNFANGTAFQTAAAARQIALYPVTGTDIQYYRNGLKYVKNTIQVLTADDTSSLKYVYVGSDGNLTLANNFQASYFQDTPIVSVFYWNGTLDQKVLFADERHGIQMDGATHRYLHFTQGTKYISGFGISGLTSTGTTFTLLESGVAYDEDIIMTRGSQATAPVLYLDGTIWRLTTATSNLGYIESGDTYVSYNPISGGTGALTEVVGNDFVCVHFVLTNDAQYPVMRLLGQQLYSTVGEAQSGISDEVNSLVTSGLPSPELLFIGSVIIDRSGQLRLLTDGSLYLDLRETRITGSGGSSGSATTASNVIYDNTASGLTAVNVQSAIDELAGDTVYTDEVQYPVAYKIGTPTAIDTANELFNHSYSSGVMSGADLTDNANGTVSLSSGYAVLRANTSSTSQLYTIQFNAQGPISLTDNSVNYIYLDYNAGSPQFVVSTSETAFNCLDKCIAWMVFRRGTEVTYIDARSQNVDGNRKMRRLFLDFSRFIHVEGGTNISTVTGVDLAVSSGAFYFMINKLTHPAFDTSIVGTANENVFSLWYRDGVGGFVTIDDQKTINTNQYDSGTGVLATLGNNKYGVSWVYIAHNTPSTLNVVVGQEEYNTFAEAREAQPPTQIPEILEQMASLIGFVIYVKGATTFAEVRSAFALSFSSTTAVSHNNLPGLQGGDVNQYFHLTTAEHTYLTGQDQSVKTTNDVVFNSVKTATITSDTDVSIQLDADNDGANSFLVKDSAGATVLSVDESGNLALSGTVDGRDVAADGVRLDKKYTESATAPVSPNLGDEWLNLTNGVLYKYVSDGVDAYWVDISGLGATQNPFDQNLNTTNNVNFNQVVVGDPFYLQLSGSETFSQVLTNSDSLFLNASAVGSNMHFRVSGDTRMFVDATGTIVGGSVTKINHIGHEMWSANLQINNDANTQGLSIVRNDNSIYGGVITLSSGRGIAGVSDGDRLGEIIFAGNDGVDWSNSGAMIRAVVNGTPGENDLPTNLIISTTPDGTGTPVERLRITSDGKVGVGTNSQALLAVFNIDSSHTNTIPTDDLLDNSQNELFLYNTNNSGLFSSIKLATRTNLSARWLIANEWKSSFIGDLVFRVRNSGTTSAEILRFTTSGVLVNTTTNNGSGAKLQVNGGTCLGSDAPSIKVKKVTGTTSVNLGGVVYLSHGLSSTSIISVNIIVHHTPGSGVPPHFTFYGGYEYDMSYDASTVQVYNSPTNSSLILAKPITVTIIYEA